ncbi:MAG: DUF805 domain-containing protein [Bifidobacteriaceae bacterium]|jgi:uncharacterized membrane protein YhaH (DUF805 family)|nr:DUF805 domain-containing protein [Bifidobacteriaceae bacterium]
MTQPQNPPQYGQPVQPEQPQYQQAPQAQPPQYNPYSAPAMQPNAPQLENNRIALSQPAYGTNPGQAFARFFKKYATFSGRASRSEYWWMMMWFAIIYVVWFALVSVLPDSGAGTMVIVVLSLLMGVFMLATIVPIWALTVRRYHDSNHSGLLYLLSIGLQVIGSVIVVVGIINVFGSLFSLVSLMASGSDYGSGLGGYGYDSTGLDSGETTSMTALFAASSDDYSALYGSVVASMMMKFFAWGAIGGLFSLAGGILNLVFTLLGSKVDGARFDSPRLPAQYTVYPPDAFIQFAPGYAAAPGASNSSFTPNNPPNNQGYQGPDYQSPSAYQPAQAQPQFQQPQEFHPNAFQTPESPAPTTPLNTPAAAPGAPVAPAAPLSPATPDVPTVSNPYTTPFEQQGEGTIPSTSSDAESDSNSDPDGDSDQDQGPSSGYSQN